MAGRPVRRRGRQPEADAEIVTGWMEQDYRFQGEPVHISSPFTVALRREGDTWKVALVHAIPMPDEGS